MSNKVYLEFEGLDWYLHKFTKVEANVPKITEKALKKAHKIITKKAEEAIYPHNKTYQTEKSLRREAEVEWEGTLASIKTGFSISEGGLASIFLMYGTPRMKKDQKLYNAFWSKSTQDEVKKAEKEIFQEELLKVWK